MTTLSYRMMTAAAMLFAAALTASANEPVMTKSAVIDGIVYQLGNVPAVTVTGHEWPAGEMIERLEPLAGVNLSSFIGKPAAGSEDPVIPVRFIGRNAFEGCIINELILPLSLEEISTDAFRNATINHIEFPPKLGLIRAGAFYGVKGIEWLNLPDGLRSVDQQAFADMPDVRQITIPPYIHLALESMAGLRNLEAIRIYSKIKPREICGGEFIYVTDEDQYPRWTLYIPKGTYKDYVPDGMIAWRSGWVGQNVVEMEDSPMAETIKEAVGERLNVKLQGRTLTLEPADEGPAHVAVYDMQGRMVADRELHGAESLTLPQGIYVVKCGPETKKIAIRN